VGFPSGAGNPQAIAATDLDGDGRIDIVIANNSDLGKGVQVLMSTCTP